MPEENRHVVRNWSVSRNKQSNTTSMRSSNVCDRSVVTEVLVRLERSRGSSAGEVKARGRRARVGWDGCRDEQSR